MKLINSNQGFSWLFPTEWLYRLPKYSQPAMACAAPWNQFVPVKPPAARNGGGYQLLRVVHGAVVPCCSICFTHLQRANTWATCASIIVEWSARIDDDIMIYIYNDISWTCFLPRNRSRVMFCSDLQMPSFMDICSWQVHTTRMPDLGCTMLVMFYVLLGKAFMAFYCFLPFFLPFLHPSRFYQLQLALVLPDLRCMLQLPAAL